jgi:hypothetical protein
MAAQNFSKIDAVLDESQKRPASIDAFTKIEPYDLPPKRATLVGWEQLTWPLKWGIFGGLLYVLLFTLGVIAIWLGV